jgi:hypothetical protein
MALHVEQQQQQGSAPVQQPGCVDKSGSPVLDDLLDPAGAANLQQLQQHGDIWSLLQGIASHQQQQQPQQQSDQAGLFEGPAAAASAAFGPDGQPPNPQSQERQQQLPTGAGSLPLPVPAAASAAAAAGAVSDATANAAAGHGMPGGLSLGDVVPLPNDFWHELMIDLAQDPVTDAHLHPGQVDVDMVDSSRSPLTVNQQLLVLLGSPPPVSSTAAAAHLLGGFQGSAAALLGGYSTAPAGPAPGDTSGVAAMRAAQQHGQQQHKP